MPPCGAACAVALWVNMTGVPDTLDRWLGGEAVTMDGVALQPPSGPVVSQADIEGYLSHTQFFQQHARNLAHFEASVTFASTPRSRLCSVHRFLSPACLTRPSFG